jgi:protein-tyrosine phosphatase
LNQRLEADAISLRAVPGADVRVDDQLLKLLDSDSVLTLADGKRYILLELPHEVLIDLTLLITELSARGLCAILSHPERHMGICRSPEVLIPWIEQGALLQVTAGSLVGAFGPTAEKMAWDLISANIVSLIATDAHDPVHRPPMMNVAIDALAKRLGHAVARRLCIENPLAVLEGRPMPSSQHPSASSMRWGGR